MMKPVMLMALCVGCVWSAAADAMSFVGVSEAVTMPSLTNFPMTVAYSTLGGKSVEVAVNGETLVSANAAGQTVWSPTVPGIYALTHRAGDVVWTKPVLFAPGGDFGQLQLGWLGDSIVSVFPEAVASVTNVTVLACVSDVPIGIFDGFPKLTDVRVASGCTALVREKNALYNAQGARVWSQTLSARIVHTAMRTDDPTVMDVTYELTGTGYAAADVRVLMFRETAGSWSTVVRPETFVDGTERALGDGMAVNAQHTFSWRISADTTDTLAKFCAMIIVRPGELLPLRIVTVPAGDEHPAYRVSRNVPTTAQLNNALWWRYADHAANLTLAGGVLKSGGVTLASGTGVSDTNARDYLYGQMGLKRTGTDAAALGRINAVTRLGLGNDSAFETVK